MRLIVLSVFLFVCVSHQRSTPDSDSYVAAVLEYQFTSNTTRNLAEYRVYIKKAAEQGADILVFPEMTLTRGVNIPVPIHGLLKDYPIPALHPHFYNEVLVSLSLAARDHQIYVVANIQEEMDCNNAPGEFCPAPKKYIFNTNVVFDRNGAVIDRYRKINLYKEYVRWPALRPELGVFSTDFGVTFGHFICFDLLFQVPATQVVQKHKLTDVVFSTMWFSEMPFLTAIQIQEAYAYAMNVNFLAAGANNVKVGSAGSGIYSGKSGALISVMPNVPKTQLLVTRVPKRPGHATFKFPGPIYDDPTAKSQLLINTDTFLASVTSRLLTPGYQEFVLVDQDVSCSFRVNILEKTSASGVKPPKYRAFVKDGGNTYSARRLGVVLCAVVACQDDTVESCPYRFTQGEALTEFQELQITMRSYSNQHNDTLDCDNLAYYPSSMRYNKFPLSTKEFQFKKPTRPILSKKNENENDAFKVGIQNGARERMVYKIMTPQTDLVDFSLWGRMYLRDVNPGNEPTVEDVNNYIDIENDIYRFADSNVAA